MATWQKPSLTAHIWQLESMSNGLPNITWQKLGFAKSSFFFGKLN